MKKTILAFLTFALFATTGYGYTYDSFSYDTPAIKNDSLSVIYNFTSDSGVQIKNQFLTIFNAADTGNTFLISNDTMLNKINRNIQFDTKIYSGNECIGFIYEISGIKIKQFYVKTTLSDGRKKVINCKVEVIK